MWIAWIHPYILHLGVKCLEANCLNPWAVPQKLKCGDGCGEKFQSQPCPATYYTNDETLEGLSWCELLESTHHTQSWCEKWKEAKPKLYVVPTHDLKDGCLTGRLVKPFVVCPAVLDKCGFLFPAVSLRHSVCLAKTATAHSASRTIFFWHKADGNIYPMSCPRSSCKELAQ